MKRKDWMSDRAWVRGRAEDLRRRLDDPSDKGNRPTMRVVLAIMQKRYAELVKELMA